VPCSELFSAKRHAAAVLAGLKPKLGERVLRMNRTCAGSPSGQRSRAASENRDAAQPAADHPATILVGRMMLAAGPWPSGHRTGAHDGSRAQRFPRRTLTGPSPSLTCMSGRTLIRFTSPACGEVERSPERAGGGHTLTFGQYVLRRHPTPTLPARGRWEGSEFSVAGTYALVFIPSHFTA